MNALTGVIGWEDVSRVEFGHALVGALVQRNRRHGYCGEIPPQRSKQRSSLVTDLPAGAWKAKYPSDPGRFSVQKSKTIGSGLTSEPVTNRDARSDDETRIREATVVGVRRLEFYRSVHYDTICCHSL